MLLAFLIILFTNEASAKLSHLTCSVEAMDVIYVAGGGTKRIEDFAAEVRDLASILTPESEFSDKGISFAEPIYTKFGYLDSQKLEKSFLEVKELGLNFPDDETIHQAVRLGAIDWQRGVQFVKFFNPLLWTKSVKTLALLGGAVVTGGISAHKSINTLSSRISINLISQKKSLVVTHGLGQQVFNLAYSNLLKGPRKDELGYVSGIALGMLSSILPPSPSDNPRFHYVVNRGDEILRSNTFANVRPNAYFDGPNPDDIGHDIINTYFSDAYVNTSLGRIRMLDFTREQIKRSVSGLLNNNPDCCEKRQGKLWVNESDCEEGQETCFGGFLEKTVKLKLDSDDELELSEDSVICGDVQIESYQSTVKIENTKLIGPLTIENDVELKNVQLDASGADINYDRALIDGKNQYVKISFTGSAYTQPNILGRPQITGPVEIYSNKSEAVITGSPTIRNRVKLNNSKIKELYPPAEERKKLTSQIILDGEFGEVQLTETSLEGKVDISGPVMMFEVTQKGTAEIQRANFTKTKLTNSYYSNSPKPGIKVLNGTSCTSQLNIGDAEIKDEADIQACGDIYDFAKVEGHVQIKGEVAISGKLFGDPYVAGQVPMRITGSSDADYGVSMFSDVEIRNRPTISGDILFDNGSKIYNNGIYRGVKQLVEPGLTYFSHISGGSYYGTNDITGFYLIQKGLTDVTVEGGYAQFGNGTYLSTIITSSASIGEGASLKGPMYIQGTIGPETIVEGKNLGFRGGIFVDHGNTFNGIGKKLEGGVFLGANTTVTNSNINGNALDPSSSNTFIEITGSTITDSSLSGVGAIAGSSVTEATMSGNSYYISLSTLLKGNYSKNISITNNSNIDRGTYTDNVSIDNSSVTNSLLSNEVQVFNATLNGTTAFGNAKLCNRPYSGGSYGTGYDCTAPPPPQMMDIKKDIVLENTLSAQRDWKLRHERVMSWRQQARKQLQSRLPASAFKKKSI